jgi:phosphatidate cytidylyltransferase
MDQSQGIGGKTMLKHRLLFGSLMAVLFLGMVLIDGWIDGSITRIRTDDRAVQGTILTLILALLIIPGQLELARLASANNLRVFIIPASLASILLATTWYWMQFVTASAAICFALVCAFYLFVLLIYQHVRYGNSSVLANCGVNCFSVLYLGALSSFCVGMRIDFGLWPLLMFVCVVKSSDIGAYASGRLFGKHKFSPNISPGKTWEGLAGAAVLATIVAISFARTSGIMTWQAAVPFGVCFAVIGQMGDLAESMIKRDAEQKDSGDKVPGFGGVLDIVDSPLVAAPFAYLFFMATAAAAN